eukprot:gene4024-47315_t
MAPPPITLLAMPVSEVAARWPLTYREPLRRYAQPARDALAREEPAAGDIAEI